MTISDLKKTIAHNYKELSTLTNTVITNHEESMNKLHDQNHELRFIISETEQQTVSISKKLQELETSFKTQPSRQPINPKSKKSLK